MLTNDEAFDAMADLRRRQVLVGLLHTDTRAVPKLSSVSREMLQAHEALLREYLSGSQEIENADKAAIRTHHVHLPKLVQYSYIEWDHDESVVTKGPEFDDVRPLLEVVEKQRDERPTTVPELSIRKWTSRSENSTCRIASELKIPCIDRSASPQCRVIRHSPTHPGYSELSALNQSIG